MPQSHPLLSHAPLLIGTVSTLDCLRSEAYPTSKFTEPCPDLVELRLDALPDNFYQSTPQILTNPEPIPFLHTYRAHSQGGAPNSAKKTAQERAAIQLQVLAYAAAIDFEWSELPAAGKIGEELFAQAQERQILRIASEHHFQSCPPPSYFNELIAEVAAASAPLRPDVLKIAVHLQRPAELATLLECLENPPLPLALMGMGPLGVSSRLCLTAAGSKLLYGYIHQANAPGQLSIRQLRQLEELWQPVHHPHNLG